MAKYRCEHCEELVEITPNGADPRTTNRRQRMVMHKAIKSVQSGEDTYNFHGLCPGSGADV